MRRGVENDGRQPDIRRAVGQAKKGKRMQVQAWIQLGVERRETVIEIPDEEFEAGKKWVAEQPGRFLECWLEEYVFDWLYVQYGWGWSGAGLENDFGFMEGDEFGGYGSLGVTSDSSIPNTKAIRLDET